mmetsp:Transcript_42272/g.122235  ORF Transcript_42272/g.122235 Transcript_42272/m.122235 type:complete len:232 (+) Transcript_42272:153-848(+)
MDMMDTVWISRKGTGISSMALPRCTTAKCGPQGSWSGRGSRNSPGESFTSSACSAMERTQVSSLSAPISSAHMGRPLSTCSSRLALSLSRAALTGAPDSRLRARLSAVEVTSSTWHSLTARTVAKRVWKRPSTAISPITPPAVRLPSFSPSWVSTSANPCSRRSMESAESPAAQISAPSFKVVCVKGAARSWRNCGGQPRKSGLCASAGRTVCSSQSFLRLVNSALASVRR